MPESCLLALPGVAFSVGSIHRHHSALRTHGSVEPIWVQRRKNVCLVSVTTLVDISLRQTL